MEEYKVIKIKFDQTSKSSHHLFYKKYKPNRNEDLENLTSTKIFQENADIAQRTLFVDGLPSYMNIQAIKNVFNVFGPIQNIHISKTSQSNPFSQTENKTSKSYFSEGHNSELEGFKIAYIVFDQATSIVKALTKPVTEERVVSTSQQPIIVGFQKWIDTYKRQFIDEKKMKKEIDVFMQGYDIKQKEFEEDEVKKTNQPDEDGWITVTTKSRKANRALTERNILKLKSKQRKKSEKMALLHFYNFQAKDTKKEYILNLRKRFEEDKKQIEEMKANRKFKPF